jgi:6,7-dimethyl-8-ribityllumazine synthase
MRIALIVSRFNVEVTDRLRSGALEFLDAHGCDESSRTVLQVPGAWELSLAAEKLATAGGHDAIVTLGALIRGETSHFDVLAHAVAAALQRTGQRHGIPVIFGVLTTENPQQALDRAGARYRNKGSEAAEAAVEMVTLYRRLKADGSVTPS